MKLLLSLLLMVGFSLAGFTQEKYVYKILADSVKITNCDSAELIIENHTQGVPGFLFNTGNGRTVFKRPLQKINDSIFLIGADTLKIKQPAAITASDGLSMAGNAVQLGQVPGASGNPAALTESREIPLNGNNLIYSNDGSQLALDFNGWLSSPRLLSNNFITIGSASNFVTVAGTTNVTSANDFPVFQLINGNPGNSIDLNFSSVIESFIASGSHSQPLLITTSASTSNPSIAGDIIISPGRVQTENFSSQISTPYNIDLQPSGTGSVAITSTWNTALSPTLLSANVTNTASGTSSKLMDLQVGGVSQFSAYANTGNMAIGNITPTAKVHITAGTAAAGTAPLKFTSGPLLTTPEPGAVEFLTDKAYLGITTGAARKELALWDATGNQTSVPFVTTNGRLTSSAKMTYNDGFAGLSVSDAQYDTHATFNGVPQYDNSYGLRVWNTGAATSTQPAMSPGINYRGQAWSTNDGQSESVEFGSWIDTRNGPQAGGNWCLQSRVNYANNSFNFFYNKNFAVNNNGGIIIYDKQSSDMPNPTLLFTDQNESEEGRLDLRGNNIAIGASTGPVSPLNCYYNIMLGQSVGNNITTGTGNILIGNYINTPSATGSNTLDIGNIIYGTNLYNGIPFGVSANPSTNANIGIAVTSPTARLQLPAGTSAGGTAPLKLTAGTVLSTPENGAVEYDGTNYYADASATRYTLAKTLTTTATLDFPGTGAQSSSDLTVTLNGVATGDVVAIGPASASVTANSCFTAWVSAANTVTIRFNNYSTATSDPASGSFRISVMKY